MENISGRELLIVAETVSKEKNLDKETILIALEEGIETSLRKNFPEGASINVNINPETGEIKAYRMFKIVNQIENLESEMLESEIEDEIVEDGYALEPFEFTLNRQQFTITKQVALQRIRSESREQHILDLLDRPNQLFNGTVKSYRKDQMIVDSNGLDIIIYRRNLLARDNFKPGDKISFVLEKDGNHYVGTRISNEYLIQVFKREVVQIEEGDIDIVNVARVNGFRSKVVLKSNRNNLDAVKACIGPKGMHIKNINLMLGENVDLISYNSDIAQLLIQAMSPVNVSHIIVDEDANALDISVPDEEIAQAIGKSGKNVELVSNLLGWTVNIFSNTEWESKNSNDNIKNIEILKAGLSCDDELAELILDSGFNTLEEIAYLPKSELYIEDLDEETIGLLRQNAKDTLSDPVALKKALGAGDLAVLGFSEEDMLVLQANNILNNFDVSELSTYDLIDLIPTLDNENAGSIIMASRKKEEVNNGSDS